MKYAAVNNDEGWIETNYYDTEAEAIDQLERDSGEKWETLKTYDHYSIQGFTDKEINDIDRRSDV